MARVFGGEPIVLDRVSAPSSAASTACSATRAERGRTGRATRAPCSSSARVFFAAALPDPAHAGDPPVQPAGPQLADLGPLVQHRRVVRDEHELAVLRRRDDDDELLADGRPGGAELRLGRRRHRGARRRHPRASRAALGHRARQLLRRPHARRCSTSCCRSRIVGALFLVSQGVVQSLGALRRRSRRSPAARADARPGPGRLAGDHQAARDQRRRLLQRQRRDAVREPARGSRTSCRC